MKHCGRMLLLALVVTLACGRSEPPAPAKLPPIEASYVFEEGPERGQLVVGVLLEWREPRVVADALPKGVFEKFVREEAARTEQEEEEPEEIEEEPIEVGAYASAADLYAKEAAVAATELGVRILLCEITRDEIDQVPVVLRSKPERPLLELCREAISESPLVHRIPRDPTRLVEARRDGRDIIVRYAAPPADARYVAPDGTVGWRDSGDATLRFPAPLDHLPLVTNRLVVTWSVDGIALRRAWTVADLVGIVDREIVTAPRAAVGGRIAVRAHYRNSLTGEPIAGEREAIQLVANGTALAETTATSDADGVLTASLRVPDDAQPGMMALDFGDTELGLDVRRDYRISIVNDRALYRPTDTVHTRILVREVPSGRPAANELVTLAHHGVRGRRAQRAVRTSEHGIASWSMPLADADPGRHTVKATLGEATATAKFYVEQFDKPLFTFDVEPRNLELRPGESAPVTIRARFFNGAPMAGAKVEARQANGILVTPVSAVADAEGTARFTITTDGRARFRRAEFTVINADGRTEKRTVDVQLRRDDQRRLDVRADGDLVVGFPCRFTISGGAPGTTIDCKLVGSEQVQRVTLDDDGRGSVEFAIETSGAVRIRAGEEFAAGSAEHRMMRPDRRVANVGESLDVSFRANDGLLCVDVLRGAELLQTLTTRIEAGSGRLAIPLTDDLAGVLTIHAHAHGKDGEYLRVLVRRDNALQVSTRPDRDVYRPGDMATVAVVTADARGNGVPTALGYWAVDEAVLALKNWNSGYETVFDALPVDASPALAEAAESHDDARIRSALGAIHAGPHGPAAKMRHHRLPALRAERDRLVGAAFDKCLADYFDACYRMYETIPFAEIRTFGSYRQQLAWLVENRYLDARLLYDPWGSPLVLRQYDEYRGIQWGTIGPDLVAESADDKRTGETEWRGLPARIHRFDALVRAHLRDDHPLLFDPSWGFRNLAIGLGGVAGGAYSGRAGGSGKLSAGIGYAPAPTRRDFPPTLVFVPELLTGPDGRATLSIPLADSITTWRMRLVATSDDGGTGVHVSRLRVSQPLHVEPWIATHLTEGDTIDLPVSVRNETDAPIHAEVRLEVTEHLRIVGDARAEIGVGARGTGAHTFRLRAVKPGKATVRIETASGSERDAVARIVEVRPDANEVVKTVSSQIGAGSAWMPKLGSPDPGRLRLDLYPSPIADTVAGIDGLIREPHG